MLHVVLEIAIILGLIVLNGVFAMSEIAVLTSKKHLLEKELKKGGKRARLVLALAREPEKFLSSVQVGITLIGILTGVFGGATLTRLLAGRLAAWGLSPAWSEGLAVTGVVLAITAATLILGELLPKKIALARPNEAAKAIAPVITAVQRTAYPLVVGISRIVDLLGALLGIDRDGGGITDHDLRAVIDEAKSAGIIERDEKNILYRVMRFADRKVSTIMTHRSRLTLLDIHGSHDQNEGKIVQNRHASYPVFEGTKDNIIGFVGALDLIGRRIEGPELREVLRRPVFVHETSPALSLLGRFRKEGRQPAIILDEYGAVQGIVTPTDILESLVGEFRDTPDDEGGIVRRKDGSYLVDALTPLDEVFDLLDLDPGLKTEHAELNTVGGLVLRHLGAIPRESDAFAFHGHVFEVVDMDGRRIDKILVTRRPDQTADETDRPH